MMQTGYLAVLCLLVAMGFTGCKGSAAPQTASAVGAPAARSAAGPAEKKCLDCHGPFDQLIASSARYVAPSGEKISPHRFVPHDSKLAKDIPECGHCHTAHSLFPPPAKGTTDLAKLNVEWCYTCHHKKNFETCKNCHP